MQMLGWSLFCKDSVNMKTRFEYYLRECPDMALMKSLAEGDSDALKRMVHEYLPMVSRTAYRILCDRRDADAVVMSVFDHVWTHADEYDGRLPLHLWILALTCRKSRLRIARRRIMYIFGIRQELVVFSALRHPLEDDYVMQRVWEVYCRASVRLTPSQKIVFTLSELEGLSEEEVAAVAGMAPFRVRYALEAAVEKVSQELEIYEKVRKIQ